MANLGGWRSLVAGVVAMGPLVGCGSADGEAVVTSEQGIAAPFEAGAPLDRAVQVVARGSEFIALQSDASSGQVVASIGADGLWGEVVTLPLENVLSITVAEDQGDVYVVAATSAEVVDRTSALGAGGVAVSVLPAGASEWRPLTSVSAADSPALATTEEFTVRAVGAHEGSAIVFVLGWADDVVELWRIGGDSATLDPRPPAGVVDFCTNDDGLLLDSHKPRSSPAPQCRATP